MKVIRVLIVDDHEIVREGLQTLLSEEPEFEVVGLVGTAVPLVLGQTVSSRCGFDGPCPARVGRDRNHQTHYGYELSRANLGLDLLFR